MSEQHDTAIERILQDGQDATVALPRTEAEIRAWYSDAEQRLKNFKLTPEEQTDLKRTLGIGKK